MYTSAHEPLRTVVAWRQQRLPHSLFVPVAMTLVVASLVGNDWPSAPTLLARGVAAWLAVLTLRLWDDLEDRRRDAQDHADRVLTQVPSARAYAPIVVGLLVVTAALTALGGGSSAVLLSVVGVLMLFYRLGGQTWPGGDFVVLVKYPFLVLALGGTSQLPSIAAQAVVFAAVCVDEVLQKPGVQRRLGSPWRKLSRGGLLVLTFGALLLSTWSEFTEMFHAS